MDKRIKIMAVTAIILIALSGQASAIAPLIVVAIQFLLCTLVNSVLDIASLQLYYYFVNQILFESLLRMLQTDSLRNLIMFPQPSIISEPVVENLVEFFIHLIIPVYALFITITAFYLIFASGSIIGRARAKSTLIKLIIAIIVTLFTIPLMQLMLDVSLILSHMILNLADIDLGCSLLRETVNGFNDYFYLLMFFSHWSAFPILMIIVTLVSTMLMVMITRFFLVIIWTLVFPITVLLHAFHFTRRMGEELLKQTLLWIFMQVVFAFVLVSISIAVGAIDPALLANGYFRMALGMAAFSLMIITPLMTIGMMDMMALLTTFGGIGLSTSGLITMVDELTIEDLGTEEVTPPTPVKPF